MKRIILLIICVFLVSCTPRQNTTNSDNAIGDGGLISLKPCGPPCFFGITPGVTSYEEAIMLIDAQKNIFINCKDIDLRKSEVNNGIRCGNGIGITFNNNIVNGIGFSLSETITIQQVIDLYGPPDLVEVVDDENYHATIKSICTLSFDQIRTFIGMAAQGGTEFMISSNSNIITIAYYSIDQYKQMRVPGKIELGVPWKGFGMYNVMPP